MMANVCETGSPIVLRKVDPRLRKIILKLKDRPSVPVKTILTSDFALDKLLQARKATFECANEKLLSVQGGAETPTGSSNEKTSTLSTCNLKARRSMDTADDIREQYMPLCVWP